MTTALDRAMQLWMTLNPPEQIQRTAGEKIEAIEAALRECEARGYAKGVEDAASLITEAGDNHGLARGIRTLKEQS